MLFSVFFHKSSTAPQQHRIIHKEGSLKQQKIEKVRGRKRIEGGKKSQMLGEDIYIYLFSLT